MKLFYEWCSLPIHSGLFCPARVTMPHGFRSVFLFDETAVEEIQAQGNSKGMQRFTTYSDCIFMDLDGPDPDDIMKFETHLQALGVNFTVWVSGGKGIHYHIPLSEMYTHHYLPQAVGQWVRDRCGEVGGIASVDFSLYRSNSLFRLPGTVHQKTRKKKKLLRSSVGSPVVLDIEQLVLKADRERPIREYSLPYLGGEQEALMALLTFFSNIPVVGTRYQTLWRVAKGLAQGGFSKEFATEALEKMNESWGEHAKEYEEVERALGEAYS